MTTTLKLDCIFFVQYALIIKFIDHILFKNPSQNLFLSKPAKDPIIPPPIIKASACFGNLFIVFKLAIFYYSFKNNFSSIKFNLNVNKLKFSN
jgi:hypothetical protein